ncbi:MAG: peptidylprolyl isomerase [Flavobacteriaceae bacterium]|nr:peptidylprolyl isomerase [Flavobacteriaceae bacterium]
MRKKIMFLFSLMFVAVQAQEKVDGVAVVVGKNIVLNSDIDKFKMELEQRSEGKVNVSNCEILEDIMRQKLISHQAVIDSVKVSEAEVNSAVERNISYFVSQLGSIDKVIAMYGFNDEVDFRKEMASIQKEQLLIRGENRKITEKVTVTPDEIRTYFNSLKEEGKLPEFGSEIELAQIVLKVKPSEEEVEKSIKELKELKKEIEDGSSFSLKAVLNSDDPGVSQNGGKYKLTRQSGFVKEFIDAAFSIGEGEISEPFESPFGYHILMVEKIRGQEREVRHILKQPKVSDEELKKVLQKIKDIRQEIVDGKITFDEAVKKYSQDELTRNSKGMVINPNTNDTKFEFARLDPALYGRVNELKVGEMSEPFFENDRKDGKMFRVLLLKTKTDTHKADFTRDYEKIQALTLQKKKEEVLDKWIKEKITDTYIKVNEEYKNCKFKYNWRKE